MNYPQLNILSNRKIYKTKIKKRMWASPKNKRTWIRKKLKYEKHYHHYEHYLKTWRTLPSVWELLKTRRALPSIWVLLKIRRKLPSLWMLLKNMKNPTITMSITKTWRALPSVWVLLKKKRQEEKWATKINDVSISPFATKRFFRTLSAIVSLHVLWFSRLGSVTVLCFHLKNNKESRDYKLSLFHVVSINDKDTKPRFKKSLRLKYKGGISAKLCLKLWFESDWYFCNI